MGRKLVFLIVSNGTAQQPEIKIIVYVSKGTSKINSILNLFKLEVKSKNYYVTAL